MNKEIIKKTTGIMEYDVLHYYHGTITALKELLEFFGFEDDDLSYITNMDINEVGIEVNNKYYEVFDSYFVVKDQIGRIQVMSPYEYEDFEKECAEQMKINKERNTMTKKELVKFLYDNYYDKEKNTIMLDALNFTPYKCNVNLSSMIVEGNIYQHLQEVKGNLYQSHQTVSGDLCQDNQKVGEYLYQHTQLVGGKFHQGETYEK